MKIRIKLYFSTLVILMILIFNVSLFGNGFYLNSIGSRAMSMGGAYIGLANDYSAVFWNPAGLTQLQSHTLSLYITDTIPSFNLKWEDPEPFALDTDAKTKKNYFSGLLSYYFFLNKKLTAGIAVYVPSDLGAEWDENELIDFPYVWGYTIWMSRIKVIAISPVVSYKINKSLSIGVSLNFYYGKMNLKRVILDEPYSESSSGNGVGFTIGFLFTPPDEICSIGITLKTGYKIRFKGEAELSFPNEYLNVSSKSDFSRDIVWPICFGWGTAFRPLNNFIITVDFQWTNWDIIDMIVVDYKDPDWSEILNSGNDIDLSWEHTLQFRIGAEYRLNENIALRGGYYYTPATTLDNIKNFFIPSLTYHGMTLGIGLRFGNLQYDFSLEYLIGLKQQWWPYGTFRGNTTTASFSITYRF